MSVENKPQQSLPKQIQEEKFEPDTVFILPDHSLGRAAPEVVLAALDSLADRWNQDGRLGQTSSNIKVYSNPANTASKNNHYSGPD